MEQAIKNGELLCLAVAALPMMIIISFLGSMVWAYSTCQIVDQIAGEPVPFGHHCQED